MSESLNFQFCGLVRVQRWFDHAVALNLHAQPLRCAQQDRAELALHWAKQALRLDSALEASARRVVWHVLLCLTFS